MPIYVWLTPLFVALILLEAYTYERIRGRPYVWKASLGSIVVYLGSLVFGTLHVHATRWIPASLWSHRIASLQLDHWWGWVVLFLAVELAYYLGHRFMLHGVRLGWASHAVHHSSEQLTLPAAGRLNWTNTLAPNWLMYLPLYWLGADPAGVTFLLELNFVYQFFLHTELCPKLGPLEWILNTPSHHRVHHALNPDYVGRNFGGVLIIYDRLFGTFAEERDDQPCRYGLMERMTSHNPFVITFHDWPRLFRELKAARSLREALGRVARPPGWSPGRSAGPLRAENA